MKKIVIDLSDETAAMLEEIAEQQKLSNEYMIIHLIHQKFIDVNFDNLCDKEKKKCLPHAP